jgi:ArsR family transcriptional regulator, cadmium/lead-responsive transcriptional repressor
MRVAVLAPAAPRAIDIKAKLFRGFADSSRLVILEVLRAGPRTVSELVAATGLSQSNASNHLACLRDCGLVVATQRGRFVTYQLSDPRIETLLSLADEVLADVARGVYECTRYTTPEPAIIPEPAVTTAMEEGHDA